MNILNFRNNAETASGCPSAQGPVHHCLGNASYSQSRSNVVVAVETMLFEKQLEKGSNEIQSIFVWI